MGLYSTFNEVLAMKKSLIYWILIIGLISLIQGCDDTFGTDPNVKITELPPKLTGEDDKTGEQIDMLARWNFIEYYMVGMRGALMNWINNFTIIKNKFIIDTTKEESVVSIDMEVNCNIPDNAIKNRLDRVLSMKFSIDNLTITANETDNIVDPEKMNTLKVELAVKDLRTGKIQILNQNQLDIIFSINQLAKDKRVRGFVNLDFDKFPNLNILNFQAIFEADFK